LRPRFRLLGVTLALAGCSVSENEYPAKFARLDCARHYQCDRSSYDLLYFGFEDCVHEDEKTLAAVEDFYLKYGCDYDPVGAEGAYDDLNSITCEQWHAGGLASGFTTTFVCE
jgi:hypothetical protein